jgi:hypothetical protein
MRETKSLRGTSCPWWFRPLRVCIVKLTHYRRRATLDGRGEGDPQIAPRYYKVNVQLNLKVNVQSERENLLGVERWRWRVVVSGRWSHWS